MVFEKFMVVLILMIGEYVVFFWSDCCWVVSVIYDLMSVFNCVIWLLVVVCELFVDGSRMICESIGVFVLGMRWG